MNDFFELGLNNDFRRSPVTGVELDVSNVTAILMLMLALLLVVNTLNLEP